VRRPFTAALAVLAATSVVAAQTPVAPQTPATPVFPTLQAQLPTPTAPPLALADAEARAIANHPRVIAARNQATAETAATREAGSFRYPTVVGSLTGVDALSNSRIAAGALNNPIIYNRFSSGIMINQLITDFGRTGNLVASASLHAQASALDISATEQDLELAVANAYFAALGAQAVLNVAADTVHTRQVVVDQIAALVQNLQKTDVDLSFANVDLGEAQLLLVQAQNDFLARQADLGNAMGEHGDQIYPLIDPTAGSAQPPPPLDPLTAAALSGRPDLASARLDRDAARRLEAAEADLERPTVSFSGAAGVTPLRQDTLTNRYAAAGVNLGIPVFNGHLFGAERSEAEARADAEDQRVREVENQVAHDVRVAWLQASAAFQRIGLTDQIVAQAVQGQTLAQARYDNGLGSIVELSQAQLNATQARVAQASARFEYAAALALLRYSAGQTP